MRFAIASLLLIAAVPASAGTITYEFTGHISYILGPVDGLGGVKENDLLITRWVFDTSAPNILPPSDLGGYRTDECFFELPNLSAQVLDGGALIQRSGPPNIAMFGGTHPGYEVDFEFYPASPTAITQVTLPTEFPAMSLGIIGVTAPNGGAAYAGVETISITPEPAALLLFTASAFLLRRSR